jgi:Zn-dependent peptidase ImmA (M78 family)
MYLNEIQYLAERTLIEKSDLSTPVDIVQLVISDGFQVYTMPLKEIENENVTGLLFVNDKSNVLGLKTNKVIIIEETLPIEKQRFVIAHEYAHYKMHKKDIELTTKFTRSRENTNRPDEIEADSFARCILMPSFIVRKVFDEIFSFKSTSENIISEIAKKFNVTTSKAEIRLKELQLIPQGGLSNE